MNYIETLSNQMTQNNLKTYYKGRDRYGWQIEYDQLDNPSKSTENAKEHMDKNRYHNILPYDDNQVNIGSYINASWVNGSIVTQWPLENTLEDFWKMIQKYNITTIIALTKIEREDQCQYWKNYVVKTVKEEDFIIRTLILDHRIIKHYQYIAWPDFKCPNIDSLLKLMSMVKGEKCIHCSAGVGRAGTFMTIDYCLKQIQNNQAFNINQIIGDLRSQRLAMVQTAEQYAFCHYAVLYYLKMIQV